MNLTAVVLIIVSFPASLVADAWGTQKMAAPPRFYIDKENCPGEGCTYKGPWTIQKTTPAFARPDARSPKLGRFIAGHSAVALTGEVQTIPGRFVVRKAHEKYRVGDVLWLYTYLGEGYFNIWYGGKMYPEAMHFTPYGPARGCEESPDCWGRLVRTPKSTWWIKLKDQKGLTGWTTEANLKGGSIY